MIIIPYTEILKIQTHGKESFPEECCGVLISTLEDTQIVLEARRMRNSHNGNRQKRYNIDPLELLELEDELEDAGQTMIGTLFVS